MVGRWLQRTLRKEPVNTQCVETVYFIPNYMITHNILVTFQIMEQFEAIFRKNLETKASRLRHYADLWYERKFSLRNIYLGMILKQR